MGTLWLIGMMGSGKTTVAALVGERLRRPVVDTDAVVAEQSGRSVAAWLVEDAAGFRAAERHAVAAVAGADAVVACGGGVVLDDASVATMRATGLVVWLEAPVEVLADRVGSGSGRPLLGADPEADLARIAAARLDRYRDAAHVTVAASGNPQDVAEEVMAAWASSS
ncbi:MAG: shikimate kinase [Acidimicrobiia bacterium]|nr:shikimate kinase [Acidimicrobiia bacterium]